MNKSFWKFLPVIVLILLSLIYFYPVILKGKTFYAFDTIFQYFPWASFNDGFYPNNTVITDPIDGFYPPHFYPAHYHFKQSVNAGALKFWFNQNFCGVPFIFYSYPISYVLFALFPITTAHDLLLFIHLLGAGIFTYYYLKKIGLSVLPSIVGAISWMFNGYVMVWFEFEHVPILAMTLAATLLCIELWREKTSVLRFIGLTCAISLSICTAYAHLIIYQLIFVGLYMIFRLCTGIDLQSKGRRSRLRSISGAICAIILSVIISANFFISHVMLLKDGQRQPISYDKLFKETGQLPKKYLATMLFPDLFGSPVKKVSPNLGSFTPTNDIRQVYNNYNELCIYMGIFSLFVVLLCIPYFRRNKFIRFFFTTALISLIMAMGSFVYYPFAAIIPGLNLSTPTRILYIFGFSVSILAALGSEILQRDEIKRKFIAVTLWGCLVSVSMILILYLQTEDGLKWVIGPLRLGSYQDNANALKEYFNISSIIILKPILLILTTFTILLGALYAKKVTYRKIFISLGILLLSYDLITFGLIYNTVSSKKIEFIKTPAIDFIKKDKSIFRIATYGKFMQHSFTPFDIEDISGYGSFYPKRYGEYIYKSQNRNEDGFPKKLNRWLFLNNYGSPLLDLINIKYILTSPRKTMQSNQVKLVYNREIKIYENLYAFPRAFFVPGYELANNAADAYMKIGRFTHDDFKKKVILESLPAKQNQPNNNEIASKIKCAIQMRYYSSDKIILDVKTNKNGFVIISNNYDPNWRAKIDGEKVEVMRANYVMQAIPISSGNHIVKIEFKPKLLQAGLYITLTGWVVLLCILLIVLTKNIVFKYYYKHKIIEA